MYEARFRTDEFRQMREEGNHIVLHFALDLIDALCVKVQRHGPSPKSPAQPLWE